MSADAGTTTCPTEDAVGKFVQGVNAQLWRSNALMVANAVLVTIMVAVGASGRRYRHAAATRFLFLGASSLYLPIVSYVASSIGKEYCSASGVDVFCHGRSFVAFLLIWTVLVQIIGTNTSAVVASDDHGSDQRLGPSIELLARTVWTSFLVFYYSGRGLLTVPRIVLEDAKFYGLLSRFIIVLCLLSLAKLMLKFYAFQKARQSLALGRNPRLIAGYMEKLQGDDRLVEVLPPLIVMGEEKQEIEEMPHGYTIKQRKNGLVTIDMVWRLAASDAVLMSRPWLKDLCLSFALFKLLRRRFARTHIAESGSSKAFIFVSDLLLSSGHPDRVFRVVVDELSFLLDSYYSSLPTSYSGRLLPILNTTVSLSIIAWCLVMGGVMSHHYIVHIRRHRHQIYCSPTACLFPPKYQSDGGRIVFGNLLFNALPTFFLFVAVIIAEAWEVMSYFCSNWLKLTLLCSYITNTCWQRSPCVQRCLDFILGLRIKFVRSWSTDQMGQMSLLPLLDEQKPRKMWYGLIRRFLCFSDHKRQHVRVPSEVKAAIVDALRSSNGVLSKGTAALRRSRIIGGELLWACQGEGASDVILTWHVATAIFDARHGGAASASSSSSPSSAASAAAVATHLSRYCVYLMAAAPELLPDDTAWSTKLCTAARKDIERALAGAAHDGGGGGAMVAALLSLSDTSEQEVVRRGARLGEQLVELVADEEEAGWAILAGFWSEMVLYVAPSENLTAHKKAIAGGAELVTIVWALLTHAGIVARPSVSTEL
ncbi:hypothetical protein ACP4OV_014985 [Aristida adscensionis]